ncbi:MAG: NHL repeat-containing protein [Thermomicrobiales bacterium]
MDDTVFDHLTRALVTRRAGLGLGLGALAGLAGFADAKKKKKKPKKNKNKNKTCEKGCGECSACQNGACQPVADGAACGSGDTCQAGVCAGSGGCGQGQKRCGAACIARDACCQDGEVCGDGTGRCLTGVCQTKPACLATGKSYDYMGEPLCCSSNIGSTSGSNGPRVLCKAGDPDDRCFTDSDCATGTCVGYRCRSCSGAACGPTYRFEWDHAWPGVGQSPTSLPQVVINSAGHALTTDSFGHRVLEMAPDGSLVRQLGVTGSPGSANGRFNHPYGIAVDAQDNIYVADSNNYRVQKFAPDGTHLQSGGDSQVFNFPDMLAFDSKQQLHVSDYYNRRVLVFKTDGTYLRAILLNSTNEVQGFGVDRRDHVFTKDYTGWSEYDANGTFISTWAVDARTPIAFSPANGIVIVQSWGDGHNETVVYTAGRQFVRSINPTSFPGAVADQYFNVDSVAFDAAGNLYISGDGGIDDGRPYVQNYRLVKFAVVPYAPASAGRKASGGGKTSRKHKGKRHHQKK